jgi:hypothetical protein
MISCFVETEPERELRPTADLFAGVDCTGYEARPYDTNLRAGPQASELNS